MSNNTSGPETLQEFINLTKGIEYIIAVVFLVLFLLFWRLLNKGKEPEDT